MENKDIEKPWWRDGVILFARVSSYIAVPIILASFAGKFLDKKYDTEPFLFYICIIVAFISTLLLIWKEMRDYKKKIEKEEKEKK